MSTREAGTAPLCPRCTKRHLATIPCWSGRYVAAVRARVLATYGDVCCHCGRAGARSVEHVRPRAFGGTDTIANLKPAHLRCNIIRGTDPMDGWAPEPVPTEVSRRWSGVSSPQSHESRGKVGPSKTKPPSLRTPGGFVSVDVSNRSA